jgi:Fe-S-cluster containining protein
VQILTSLEKITVAEMENADENFHFKEFIRNAATDSIDEMVTALNLQIAPEIDCTTCGNCCKSLMIPVTETECMEVSARLHQSDTEFRNRYVETSQEGQMVINTIPCHFLKEKKCTIYENRFAECRDFPHLHKPNFKSRIQGTLMHYGRCPIIYNVIESLKIKTGFKIKPVANTKN